MQMRKETIAVNSHSLGGRCTYAAPEVTVVEYRMERGFLFSNHNPETRTQGRDAWDYAPDYQSEDRSFGGNAWSD